LKKLKKRKTKNEEGKGEMLTTIKGKAKIAPVVQVFT
jgi:hypothetical protein